MRTLLFYVYIYSLLSWFLVAAYDWKKNVPPIFKCLLRRDHLSSKKEKGYTIFFDDQLIWNFFMMFSFLENDDLVWFGVQWEETLEVRTAGGQNHLANKLCTFSMNLNLERKKSVITLGLLHPCPHTVYPWRHEPFYIVTYYINWVKTYCTYSNLTRDRL